MSTVRAVLAVAAGGAFGCGVAFLILNLGARQAGIAVAVSVGLLVLGDVVRHVQRRSERRQVQVSRPVLSVIDGGRR